MFRIGFANTARKNLKKLRKNGRFSDSALRTLLIDLRVGSPLPSHYRDHELHGALKKYRECHLSFDLLVLYTRNTSSNRIIILEIGTHDELFG